VQNKSEAIWASRGKRHVGLEQAYWVGSDGFGSWVCYIRAVGKKSLIFSFLSLSIFSLEREALFSLLSHSSSPMETGGGRRWRRRRCKPLLFPFFLRFSNVLPTLFSFLVPKIPNPKPKPLDLEKEKENYLLLSLGFDLVSDSMSSCG